MSKKPKINLITEDTWQTRRRWMIVILAWLIGNAQYLIVFGNDNALHQNALIAILGAVVATMGSYVFGAVWDDNDKRRHFPASETGE